MFGKRKKCLKIHSPGIDGLHLFTSELLETVGVFILVDLKMRWTDTFSALLRAVRTRGSFRVAVPLLSIFGSSALFVSIFRLSELFRPITGSFLSFFAFF